MKKSFKVIYSPAAAEDLISIYSYICFKLQASNAAREQINRIRETVRKLDELPERYEAVDWEPWASINIRKAPVENHVVFYSVDNKKRQVIIVRIVYGGRDINSIINSGSRI